MAKADTYVLGLFLLTLGGFIQGLPGFSVLGIVPNLVFATLIIFAFFWQNFGTYLSLALIGALTLRFGSIFSLEMLVFLLVILGIFFLRVKSFAARSLLAPLFVFFGTLVLYLGLDPSFFLQNFALILSEAIYNSFYGLGLFGLLYRYETI